MAFPPKFAPERIRTSTVLRLLAPEASASASSATGANLGGFGPPATILFFHPLCFNIPLGDVGETLGWSDDSLQTDSFHICRHIVDEDMAADEYGWHVTRKNFLELSVFGRPLVWKDIRPGLHQQFVRLGVGKSGKIQARIAQLRGMPVGPRVRIGPDVFRIKQQFIISWPNEFFIQITDRLDIQDNLNPDIFPHFL